MDGSVAFSITEIAADDRLEVFTDAERSLVPRRIERVTDQPSWDEIAIADFDAATIMELAASPTHCAAVTADTPITSPGPMLDVVLVRRCALNQAGSRGKRVDARMPSTRGHQLAGLSPRRRRSRGSAAARGRRDGSPT